MLKHRYAGFVTGAFVAAALSGCRLFDVVGTDLAYAEVVRYTASTELRELINAKNSTYPNAPQLELRSVLASCVYDKRGFLRPSDERENPGRVPLRKEFQGDCFIFTVAPKQYICESNDGALCASIGMQASVFDKLENDILVVSPHRVVRRKS